jgi:hypothetical protein
MANANVTLGASAIHGIGVFAARALPAGTVVLSIDDSRIVTAADPLRPGEADYHCDYLGPERTVLMQPPERHINHSCDPNTFVRTIAGTRQVIALRDIAAGEEITYDYCINGYGDAVWQCSCGAARCRGTVHADFFRLPLALQQEYLPLLDEWFIAWRRDKVQRVSPVKSLRRT